MKHVVAAARPAMIAASRQTVRASAYVFLLILTEIYIYICIYKKKKKKKLIHFIIQCPWIHYQDRRYK